MRILRLFCLLAAWSILGAGPLPARVWTDAQGRTMEAELVQVADGLAFFKKDDGQIYQFELAKLSPADQEFCRNFKLSEPPAAHLSKIARAVEGELVVPDEKGFKKYERKSQPEPEYYAIYFSAHWCAPCRQFTPKLVEFYHQMKAKHANFEVIFVSFDHTEKEMLKYMRDVQMPWPALRYEERKKNDLAKYASDRIPFLIVVDREGHMLAPTVRGHAPAAQTLEALGKMLGEEPNPPKKKNSPFDPLAPSPPKK